MSAAPGTDRPAPGAAIDAVYASGLALWQEAERAAALFLVDPVGLGGVCLTSPAGAVRDQWLAELRRLAGDETAFRNLPLNTGEDRLIGGVSIEGSLKAGRLVAERGLLAEANGQILVARMAERMEPGIAAQIASAIDSGEVLVERVGASRRDAARFGLILLDESVEPHEAPPAALRERLAFRVELSAVPPRIALPFETAPDSIAAARARFAQVTADEDTLEAIVQAAASVGATSLRAPLFCLRAARAAAALAGRSTVAPEDARLACRLILAPVFDPGESEDTVPEPPPEDAVPDMPEDETGAPDPPDTPSSEDEADAPDPAALEEMLVEAVRGAALERVLAGLQAQAARRKAGAGGKSGQMQRGQEKGRPDRSVPAGPRLGRVDLTATLRAAVPWQTLRGGRRRGGALQLRREDLRVRRFRERRETSVIFLVDASGSSALARMAEAKGAVEYLLADCYARRDHVALIGFRAEGADLLLPPTRSLVRVRRSLAGLPGGGGTPLAAGLLAAAALAEAEAARGRTPYLVILSDGRGNIALNGSTDREQVEADTEAAARRLKALGETTLFFDTGRRPSPRARALAEALGGAYRPLPYAGSAAISETVRSTMDAR